MYASQIQHFGPLFLKEGMRKRAAVVVGMMRLVVRWKGKVLAHLLRSVTTLSKSKALL